MSSGGSRWNIARVRGALHKDRITTQRLGDHRYPVISSFGEANCRGRELKAKANIV